MSDFKNYCLPNRFSITSLSAVSFALAGVIQEATMMTTKQTAQAGRAGMMPKGWFSAYQITAVTKPQTAAIMALILFAFL